MTERAFEDSVREPGPPSTLPLLSHALDEPTAFRPDDLVAAVRQQRGAGGSPPPACVPVRSGRPGPAPGAAMRSGGTATGGCPTGIRRRTARGTSPEAGRASSAPGRPAPCVCSSHSSCDPFVLGVVNRRVTLSGLSANSSRPFFEASESSLGAPAAGDTGLARGWLRPRYAGPWRSC